MIERRGWGYVLICDHCEEEIEGFEEFDDAVKYKKTHNWKSQKSQRGNWFEFCPTCSTPEIMQEYKNR